MTIHIFLLDDHEIVRRGLRELLETVDDFEVVGEAGTAAEAGVRIPALHPDVAIFDARLPDGSGIDVCRDVRSQDPSIAALVLTSYDDDKALSSAILAGAAGYLLKDIKGNGLIEAIRAVAAGKQLIRPADVERVRRSWAKVTQVDPRLGRLSPQEKRILDHVAQGLTNRQIGEQLSLAEKTVKNYVTAVLGKLGMESRTQAAVFAVTHEPQNTAWTWTGTFDSARQVRPARCWSHEQPHSSRRRSLLDLRVMGQAAGDPRGPSRSGRPRTSRHLSGQPSRRPRQPSLPHSRGHQARRRGRAPGGLRGRRLRPGDRQRLECRRQGPRGRSDPDGRHHRRLGLPALPLAHGPQTTLHPDRAGFRDGATLCRLRWCPVPAHAGCHGWLQLTQPTRWSAGAARTNAA